MLELIDNHTGKHKGERGITIHLLEQGSSGGSKSITVHGVSIQSLYEKLLFYPRSLEVSDKGVDIIIK